MDKFEGYKSQKEKHEAILDEIAKEIEKITFSRATKEEIPELKESEEKFRARSRELWKELVVHGILHFDYEEKKTKLLPVTDLDGKTCLGLLCLAGFSTKNVSYVPPGEFVPGAINLDTGGVSGIKVEERTAWLDHHGAESTKTSIPGCRWVYLGLIAKGFLKKDPVLDKLTQFVSRIDRRKFPESEKYFETSDRTVLGLQRFFSFENLYDYFRKGRTPTEILSDEDLEKYNLTQRSKEQRGLIAKSREVLERMEKEGFVVNTKFGKVVIDIGKEVPAGYQAVRGHGFDGYLLYSPRTESFFISINRADLSKIDLKQGKNIRKNMWIKPQAEEEPLKISLGEIIEKLGGKIPAEGELKKAVEANDLKFKEFIVAPRISRDKEGRVKVITWDLGKLALFPRGFSFKPGEKYRVRIKGDSAPGERKGFYILEVFNH